jgi:hypothetical protein
MELAQELGGLFQGLDRAHGALRLAGKKGEKLDGKYQIKKVGPSEDDWQLHLDGTQSIGVFPLRDDARCYWGCIDIDEYPIDFEALEAKLVDNRIPAVLCRSKSNGAHVFVFVSDGIDAAPFRKKLKEWAAALGYPKAEVFPKQDSIERDEVGNFVNMPYFGGSRLAVFNGENIEDPTAFVRLARTVAKSSDEVLSFVLMNDDEFEDGPPCLQQMATEGIGEGTRNDSLYMAGVFFRQKHEDWEGRLEEFNLRYVDPPVGKRELNQLAGSLAKNPDYFYTCEKEPMCSLCDRDTCLTRKYGVGGGGNVSLPPMGPLRRIMSDPPIWRMVISEVDCVFERIDDLTNYARFRSAVMTQVAGVWLPTLQQKSWDRLFKPIYDSEVQENAPKDAGEFGTFENLLFDFLTSNAVSTDTIEDIERGVPYYDEKTKTTYFKSTHLMAYLKRQGFGEWKKNKVFSRFRELGGFDGEVTYWSHARHVWYIEVEESRLGGEFEPKNMGEEY